MPSKLARYTTGHVRDSSLRAARIGGYCQGSVNNRTVENKASESPRSEL